MSCPFVFFRHLSTSWTLGGGHGIGTCRFAMASSYTNATEFNMYVQVSGINCPSSSSGTRNVFIKYPYTGTHYLQFLWVAGDNTRW
jgi:hypothetical protein